MKKLISLLLALMMIMSLATVAFAEEPALDQETSIKFTKTYVVQGGTVDAADVIPAEEISFTVKPHETDPQLAKNTNLPTIEAKIVNALSNDFIITLPSYTATGKYNYTVTETAGTAQGVTYATSTFDIQVLAYYVADGDSQKIVTDVEFTTKGNDAKVSNFTNIYKLGSLEVTKTIAGNMASADVPFEINVTFTADEGLKVLTDIAVSGGSERSNIQTITGGWTGKKTVTVNLKANETAIFENIPDGVSYKIEENAKHIGDADYFVNDTSKGYTATYTAHEGEITGGTDVEAVKAGVLNEKSVGVATGVITDSAPYILLIAVCAAAAVLFVIKRRNSMEF